MPGAAARRGPRELSRTLRFQVLRVAFEVTTDAPAVAEALEVLVHSATQPGPPERRIGYEITRAGGGYRILRDGVPARVEFDPPAVLRAVYPMVQRDALEAWPRAAVLHAVTGEWPGRGGRFLIIGESRGWRWRAGGRLAELGARVEGDDLAILAGGEVVALPRRLHGADGVARDDPPGHRVVAGRPSLVVRLEVNPGGHGRVTGLGGSDAVRALLAACDPFTLGRLETVRTLSRLGTDAGRLGLRLGHLDDLERLWPGCAA